MTALPAPSQPDRCDGQFSAPKNRVATPPQPVSVAELRTWFQIAMAWSPRSSIRVDTHGDHTTYRSLRLRTAAGRKIDAPRHPWALNLHSVTGQLLTLAVDFDTKPGTDPTADANDFTAHLTRIGCPYLLSESSPGTGRRHVWVLFEHSPTSTQTAALRAALTRRYPSVDVTALANSRTGCVRFVGSPHRHGGHAQPIAIGVPPNRLPEDVLSGRARAHRHVITCLPQILAVGERRRSKPRGWVVTDRGDISAAALQAASDIASAAGLCSPITDRRAPRPATHQPSGSVLSGSGDDAALTLSALIELADSTTSPSHPPIAERRSIHPTQLPRIGCETGGNTPPFEDVRDHLVRDALTPGSQLDAAADASAVQAHVVWTLLRAGYDTTTIVDYAMAVRPAAFTHSLTVRDATGRHRRSSAHATVHLRDYIGRHARRLPPDPTSNGHAALADHTSMVCGALLDNLSDHPHLGWRVTTLGLQRTFTAHVARALSCRSTTYCAGVRDLADDAAFLSPQTISTYTAQLIRWGILKVVQPASGTRATTYQILLPNWVYHRGWTQGEPAPRPIWTAALQHLPTSTIAATLRSLGRHFRHDVWTSPALGTSGALVAFVMAQLNVVEASQVSALTGISEKLVCEYQHKMAAVGLVDRAGNVRLNSRNYRVAAQRTATSGRWHMQRVRWQIERRVWSWWCAETAYLAADRATKRAAYHQSKLHGWGRFPRRANPAGGHPLPDFGHAMIVRAAEHTPTVWEAT